MDIQQPSYPLVFKLRATVTSNRVQLPPDTVKRVIVSSSDGCTHQIVSVGTDGAFDVNFQLRAMDPQSKIMDSLKFHFYTDSALFLASGAVHLGDFLGGLDQGGSTHFTTSFNFTPNAVHATMTGPPGPSAGLEAFRQHPPATSALWDTEKASTMFASLSEEVSSSLRSKLLMPPEIGAPLFTHVLTAHAMEGQFTTHMHYQLDMEPTRQQTRLLQDSGLTMMAVADTLHFWGRNADEVKQLDPVEFTKFTAACGQMLQRSALIMPYVPDACITADAQGKVGLKGTEQFKRFLSEPMDLESDTPLAKDDCEGDATAIHVIVRSFQHLFEDEQHTDPDVLLPRLFPAERFKMATINKRKVLGLAMMMGEQLSQGLIESCTTMVSSHAASLGAGISKGLQGHVTQTMLSRHRAFDEMSHLGANFGDSDKSLLHCENILMEGTNAIQADTKDFRVKIVSKSGHITEFPFSDIANTISKAMQTGDKEHSRVSIHMNQAGRMPFYTGVFCQGGNLVAMRTDDGKGGKCLSYGIPIEKISDYDSKVMMPITTDNDAWLRQHCEARKLEIHPPLVSQAKLNSALRNWSPLTYFAGVGELEGKEITNCVVSEAFESPDLRAEALRKAQITADAFNAKPVRVGYMSVWSSMDSVFRRVSLEHTQELQAMLQHTLGHMLDESEEMERHRPCLDRS